MSEQPQTQTTSTWGETPAASEFTSSSLRNRLRVELDAPISQVWELMGDLSRFPEYSEGLERVETKHDEDGRCIEYTCYFKPPEKGSEGPVSREVMKWYEPERGYLSVELEGDAGTLGAVALMTLNPIPAGTRLTYDMHYDAEDLETMKATLDEVNVDMADKLIARFGGRVTERYVEP